MNFPKHVPLKKSLTVPRNLMKLTDAPYENHEDFFDEAHFRHLLRVERMRTERSKKPFLLLLLDITKFLNECLPHEHPESIKLALIPALREVDIRGWYHMHSTIGIIFTEMKPEKDTFFDLFVQKMRNHFCQTFNPDWLSKIDVTCHPFPESKDDSLSDKTFNINLYPDLTGRAPGRKLALKIKKIMDVLGSLIALLVFAPLFLLIAAAIKATSDGPVFFKQQRVGQNGKTFNMLKFRSMKNGCNSDEHQNYIKKYICENNSAAAEPGVFKLTHDSRITPIGRLLRKTSLDELPQFINVLKGDMSLVGPRPPIPYECELYETWHRRRLQSCMPGITGLWQVSGRSRTTFDDMVRLDLKYVREWSLWLDIKILFMTPMAVFNGNGAL